MSARVAKHIDKLKAFQFKVSYQPGSKNQLDYGSRHPGKSRQYTDLERERLGVEDETKDMEIIVNRVGVGYVPEAVTLEVIKEYTSKDEVLSSVMKEVQKGQPGQAVKESKYEGIFEQLACVQGLLLKGNRVVIPNELVPDILEIAHEGHPAEI